MSTRIRNKVVPSTTTPGMAVPTAGSEVTGPATATPVATPGAGTPPATTPSLKGVVVALDLFVSGFVPMVEVLAPYLQPEPTGTARRPAAVSAQRLRAMPLLADLIRQQTVMGSADEADAIHGGVAAGVAARSAINLVEVLLSRLKVTERQEESVAWQHASVAYKTGQVRSRKDGSLNVALTPIRVALRKGPRVVTTARNADVAARKATAAQARGQGPAARRSSNPLCGAGHTGTRRRAPRAGVACASGQPAGTGSQC